jgi:hypothetical protein
MKPRNRDINIFNLSMLDVISGALGAFLIIMIILFPYYRKETIDYTEIITSLQERIQSLEQQQEETTAMFQAARAEAEAAQMETQEARQALEASREEIQNLQRQVQTAMTDAEQARQQLRESQAETDVVRQQLGEAQRQLARTFLVIYIRWATAKHDIDLHVIDPTGAEFNYTQKVIPGRPGELSEDSQVGPGNEVWEIFNAPPGTYRVFANLFNSKGNPAIPEINGRVIHRDGSQRLNPIRLPSTGKKLMATILVKEDGTVEIN